MLTFKVAVIGSFLLVLCSTSIIPALSQGDEDTYKHLQPIITSPVVSGPYELVTGESLQISCQVNKTLNSYYSPHPISMWWCNTTDSSCFQYSHPCKTCINITRSHSEAVSFGTNLTIKHTSYADTETYSCLAFTDESYYDGKPGKASVQVKVKDKFGPIFTVTPSQNLTKTIGRNVELVCMSDGYPTPTSITWYKDGALLQVGRLLQLFNVSEKHTGLYHCGTVNRFAQLNSSAILLTVEEDNIETYKVIIYIVSVTVAGVLLPAVLLFVGCCVLKTKEESVERCRNSESSQRSAEDEERLIIPSVA